MSDKNINNLTADMPKQVRELIDDLKFTIDLPSGSRLSIHNKKYSNYSIIESIHRTFWRESRINTYNWLCSLIDRSIEIAASHSAWSYIIQQHIDQLIGPINILKQTYRDDPNIVSKLSTLLYRVKLPLNQKNESVPTETINININKIKEKNVDLPQSYSTAIDYLETQNENF